MKIWGKLFLGTRRTILWKHLSTVKELFATYAGGSLSIFKSVRIVLTIFVLKTTAHELQLPVFYRESLARLLALEKFRNQIEANITAGITLYTDHKPGLYEGSLSNKGQLSAWKLVENSDLLSIVQNLYGICLVSFLCYVDLFWGL